MCSAYVELALMKLFYKILDSYVGIAQVRNNMDQPFKGIVREKYDAVPIKTDKRSSLASLLSQFPFGREILPVSDRVYVQTPSPIIY
jgi:hypothetical protein